MKHRFYDPKTQECSFHNESVDGSEPNHIENIVFIKQCGDSPNPTKYFISSFGTDGQYLQTEYEVYRFLQIIDFKGKYSCHAEAAESVLKNNPMLFIKANDLLVKLKVPFRVIPETRNDGYVLLA